MSSNLIHSEESTDRYQQVLSSARAAEREGERWRPWSPEKHDVIEGRKGGEVVDASVLGFGVTEFIGFDMG